MTERRAAYVTARTRSSLEAEMALHLRAIGAPEWVEEYKFDPVRRWKFDFAWPALMLAVEIEGGAYSQGRHTRGSGFTGDCEKYNFATLAGWSVYRFTGEMVHSGEAARVVEEALKRA